MEKEDSECLEVLVVKAAEAFFIPKVAAIIKGVSFQTGSTQTEIGGADNSNAKPGFHIAKSHGTGALPFVAQTLGNPLHGVDCFRAKHAINGDNKGNKGATELLTFVVIFLFLFLLRSHETLQGIFVHIGSSIEVLDSNVEDGVGAAGKETTDQQVTALCGWGRWLRECCCVRGWDRGGRGC